jgi:hypothetical protein
LLSACAALVPLICQDYCNTLLAERLATTNAGGFTPGTMQDARAAIDPAAFRERRIELQAARMSTTDAQGFASPLHPDYLVAMDSARRDFNKGVDRDVANGNAV